MGGGYGGEMIRFVGEKFSSLGGWFSEAFYHITHDPLWGGIALVVILLIGILVFARGKSR